MSATVHPIYKKRAIPQSARRAVAAFAGGRRGETTETQCVYCGEPGQIVWLGAWVRFPGLELDHHVPERLGGGNGPANIVLACRRCNRSRGHRHDPRLDDHQGPEAA